MLTLQNAHRWGNRITDVEPWEDVERSCEPPKTPLPTADNLLDQVGSHKARLGLDEFKHRREAVADALRERLIDRLRRMAVARLNVAHKFDVLASQWERETRNLSSVRAVTTHPAYQAIIGMGPVAVPLILRRMQKRPGLWFEALRQIAGPAADPVKPAMRGNVQRMTDAWLKWGTERGHI